MRLLRQFAIARVLLRRNDNNNTLQRWNDDKY